MNCSPISLTPYYSFLSLSFGRSATIHSRSKERSSNPSTSPAMLLTYVMSSVIEFGGKHNPVSHPFSSDARTFDGSIGLLLLIVVSFSNTLFHSFDREQRRRMFSCARKPVDCFFFLQMEHTYRYPFPFSAMDRMLATTPSSLR